MVSHIKTLIVLAACLLIVGCQSDESGSSGGLSGLTIGSEGEQPEKRTSGGEVSSVSDEPIAYADYSDNERSALHQVERVIKLSGRINTEILGKNEDSYKIICFKKQNRKPTKAELNSDFAVSSSAIVDKFGFFEILVLPNSDIRCGLHDLNGKRVLQVKYINKNSPSKTLRAGVEVLNFPRSMMFSTTKIKLPMHLLLFR